MRGAALPLWPVARTGEALAAVGRATKLAPRDRELGDVPGDARALAGWLDAAGTWIGVEVDAITAPYDGIEQALAGSAPALIRIPGDEAGQPVGVLAVVRGRGRRLVVLGVDLRPTSVAISDVRAALCRSRIASHAGEVGALLDRTGIAGPARARAADAMIAARLHAEPIDGIYLVRRPPEASPRALARDHRVTARLAGVVALHTLDQILWLGSWWVIGRGVLGGTMSSGWLAAWGLLLASSQIARIAVTWSSGKLAIDAGALLSQRLLAGALRTDPDQLRRDGVGVALGRVLESNAVHQLAVTGGLQSLLSILELMFAAVVLGLGAGGALHVILLVAVLALTMLAARNYLAARRAWTGQRFELTHALVEGMVGHATRLAQGDLDELSTKDDRALVRYLGAARDADRAAWRLRALAPCWALVAAAGLAPALLLGAPTAGALATTIGGMILATQGITRFAQGGARIVDAMIAWGSISTLAAAAAVRPESAPPSLVLAERTPGAPAIAARGISFRHVGRGAPVLSDCDLVVARGERVLLQGASGSGKSTFAAVLAGLRKPQSGLVLSGGLDRASVGVHGWHRRVACAPQFHDNHMFGATLAFNLLMGRAWPPTRADLHAASAMCRDLGLGELVSRMPGGLFQQVGEIGWQLSHGERSRVFLARALLQDSDVVVLDESLAALDPESLAMAIRCIEARAPTAIVIAHP